MTVTTSTMFQLPEELKAALITVAGQQAAEGHKKPSINTLIKQALEHYFNLEQELRSPGDKQADLEPFVLRIPAELRTRVIRESGYWQIQLGNPISMSRIVITAIERYLDAQKVGLK